MSRKNKKLKSMDKLNNNLLFSTKTCLMLFVFHHLFSISKASFDDSITSVPFSRGLSPLFGEPNIKRSSDDSSLHLHLNEFTGSGFQSSDLYNHGFFSAKIKLPSDYTAGIVVAFYTTNGDLFQKTHDELDFEFLGNIRGQPWRFQTNMYGNGSTNRGREERYTLWFDPSQEFHRYSILWTANHIIFYIDDVPIREIVNSKEMGGDYPSKPMSLYATIWDASDWATSGGKYKANYKYAPFVAEFTDLALHGCAMDPLQEVVNPSCIESEAQLEAASYNTITTKQRMAMKKYRLKYMYYSYCHDTLRYPTPLPECEFDPLEKARFKDTGRLKFVLRHHHRRHAKRRSNDVQVLENRSYGNQDNV